MGRDKRVELDQNSLTCHKTDDYKMNNCLA